MTHRRIRARLSEYLDRKLPPEQRSTVEAHLAECADCSAQLSELERTVDLLRRLPDPEPPPYLAQAVMARVEAGEGQPESPAQRFRRLIGPAFAMPVAAALGGLLLFALVDFDIRFPTGEAPSAGTGTVVAEADDAPEPTRVAARPRSSPVQHRSRRGEPAEMARLLRGAGHPHSALLATHFEQNSEIALASW